MASPSTTSQELFRSAHFLLERLGISAGNMGPLAAERALRKAVSSATMPAIENCAHKLAEYSAKRNHLQNVDEIYSMTLNALLALRAEALSSNIT